MKKYTFRKGKHDAAPAPQLPRVMVTGGALAPIFPSSLSAAFRFTDGCWFDWIDDNGVQDADIFDWNYKLFGVSPVLEPGNWNGCVLAARPKVGAAGVLEFAFYQNIRRDNFPNENKRFEYAIRDIDRMLVGVCRQRRREIQMEVVAQLRGGETRRHGYTYSLERDYNNWRELFLWFGGQNNANGEYGGVPDRDIVVFAEKF